VLSSRYFSDTDAAKVSAFLHVPIDGVVIRRLRSLASGSRSLRLKRSIPEESYAVQEALAVAALDHKIPRVWFDDNWGDRQ